MMSVTSNFRTGHISFAKAMLCPWREHHVDHTVRYLTFMRCLVVHERQVTDVAYRYISPLNLYRLSPCLLLIEPNYVCYSKREWEKKNSKWWQQVVTPARLYSSTPWCITCKHLSYLRSFALHQLNSRCIIGLASLPVRPTVGLETRCNAKGTEHERSYNGFLSPWVVLT